MTLVENPDAGLERTGWEHAEDYLTVGREYEVYAVYSSYYCPGGDAYLICDDNYDGKHYYWPIYIPACYFEITDSNKPLSWIVSPQYPRYEGPAELTPDKYELLVDGNRDMIKAFQIIKAQID